MTVVFPVVSVVELALALTGLHSIPIVLALPVVMAPLVPSRALVDSTFRLVGRWTSLWSCLLFVLDRRNLLAWALVRETLTASHSAVRRRDRDLVLFRRWWCAGWLRKLGAWR